VAGDAVHLGDDHPQVLGFIRQLILHQFLDRQSPAEVHIHAGQIIHPVGVRNPLSWRKILADLFRAAVQVADMRHALRDDFAVGPQHQPQHAVRAGMLRPHVHQHLVGANVEFNDAGIVQMRCHGNRRVLLY